MPAPLIVFAYNRPFHTRKVLESVKRNALAASTELFIFIDGLKPGASAAQKENNEKVKQVAREEEWCGKVNVIESEVNLGLAASVVKGVTDVVNKFGKVIVLEDDLVCDLHFLKFMNDALDLYEHEQQVACITGYIYPVRKPLPETFFLKGADCWGWATWQRGWNCLETDASALLQELQNKNLTSDFDFNSAYPYTQMLKDRIAGKNNSWAILWYASAYLKNYLTLYPGTSLVSNIGNDGSGTHVEVTDKFEVQLQGKEITVKKTECKENKEAKAIVEDYFRSTRPAEAAEPGLLAKIKNWFC